jgi:hypothetical protein
VIKIAFSNLIALFNVFVENSRRMSFVYIVVTVTIGYPLVTGICTAAGLTTEWAFYVSTF